MIWSKSQKFEFFYLIKKLFVNRKIIESCLETKKES